MDPTTVTPSIDASISLFALMSTIVGGVIWGIRLEGKVNANRAEAAAKSDAIEKLIDLREKYQDERHNEVKNQLTSISGKLDRLLEKPADKAA